MEKLPSVTSVEDQEKEISPERRGRMWETLKMGALVGLIALGSYKAGELAREIMPGLSEDEQTEVFEKAKQENQVINEHLKKEWEEKQALTIQAIDGRGSRVENGKLIKEAQITTEDGRIYETRAETDLMGNDEHPSGGAVGGLDWNRAFASSVFEDGSGMKVVYEVTKDGIKMTVQQMGPGGKMISERTTITQEK